MITKILGKIFHNFFYKAKITKKFAFAHLTYQPHTFFLWKKLAQPFLRKILRITSDDVLFKNRRTPYILIPNHCSALDPFIFYSSIYNQIHFVVSDGQMRIPIVRFFLEQGGCVSKKKGQKETKPIKEILHILRHLKEPVGIFAEGVNTWDGTSNPVVEGTAALIKLAQVPVIYGNAHGAYLTYPRWARRIRRGRINVRFRLLLSVAQIKKLDKKAIAEIVNKAYVYDEFEQQKRMPIAFYSSVRAEYIERVLFACPYCLQTQSIISKKQYFSCKYCRHTWLYDVYGSFHLHSFISSKLYTPINKIDNNIATWNSWQKDFLQEYIAKFAKNEIFFSDDLCVLKYGTHRASIVCGIGRVTLTTTHINFMPMDTTKNKMRFNVADLFAVNIQNNEKLEWTKGKLFYQISGKNPRANMYKYMLAIKYLQNPS